MQQEKTMACKAAMIVVGLAIIITADRGKAERLDDVNNKQWPTPIDQPHGCSTAGALHKLATCFIVNDNAKWLTSAPALNIAADMKGANWAEFVEKTFDKGDAAGAIDELLHRAGGIDAVVDNARLIAIDATTGNQSIATRRRLCDAAERLLYCANRPEKSCFAKARSVLAIMPITIAVPIGGGRQLPIDAAAVMTMAEKARCMLCDKEAAQLKMLAEKLVDKTQRQTMQQVLTDEMSGGESQYCNASKSSSNKLGSYEESNDEKRSDECNFVRRAECIADRMQTGNEEVHRRGVESELLDIVVRQMTDCKEGIERAALECKFDSQIEMGGRVSGKNRAGSARAPGAVAIGAMLIAAGYGFAT